MSDLAGTFSWASGWTKPGEKSLVELARNGGNDLLHVISILLKDGSEAAENIAERLFDDYA